MVLFMYKSTSIDFFDLLWLPLLKDQQRRETFVSIIQRK